MASNQYDAQASTNYKEAFSLFDKRGNGRVTIDSLGDLLRACGQNPTMTEIRDLEKNVGGDCEYPCPLGGCGGSLRLCLLGGVVQDGFAYGSAADKQCQRIRLLPRVPASEGQPYDVSIRRERRVLMRCASCS